MSDVPDRFIPDTYEILGGPDLPVCPGCSTQIGPGEIQHASAVVTIDGDTWHRDCADEAGADR